MAAEIQLSDGTPAIYDGKWHCADPKAVPMLEYFTEKILDDIYISISPNPDADIAKHVVAKIVGAKLVRYDPVENEPGIDDHPNVMY